MTWFIGGLPLGWVSASSKITLTGLLEKFRITYDVEKKKCLFADINYCAVLWKQHTSNYKLIGLIFVHVKVYRQQCHRICCWQLTLVCQTFRRCFDAKKQLRIPRLYVSKSNSINKKPVASIASYLTYQLREISLGWKYLQLANLLL